jgi:hypothetical protein
MYMDLKGIYKVQSLKPVISFFAANLRRNSQEKIHLSIHLIIPAKNEAESFKLGRL